LNGSSDTDLLYRDGMKAPRQPQPHECSTSNTKSSGSFGGEVSSRKDRTSLSASRRVIIPHRRDETGIAPALLSSSSWTGVHWIQVIPRATRRLWISL